MENKYHFFWKGKLSNWTKSKFTYNGYEYNCGEQMMMHQKSLLFNDEENAKTIMMFSDPKIIKSIGRQVKNFNSYVWDENKYRIVKEGLKARFEQDLEAKNELLKFKGKIFVEASPFDKIWGIGYDKDKAIPNIQNWGENLLGKILTEISDEI